MVTLVRDHFFDAVHVHSRFLVWRFLRFLGNQLRYVLARLRQGFHDRRGVPLVGFLQRDRQYRSGLQIDNMFGFVRQMRPPILHLGNARVRIMRFTHSWLLAFFFRWRSNRARSSRLGVSIPDSFARPDAEMISTTDPDAILTTKGGGTAMMAYYDNYLIDTASRVILGVEATPALFRQEMVAARRMIERVEKLGLRPESLGADKAYGSGEFLAWLLERGIQPHIPVIDRRHQTRGRFTREQFRYEPAENVYYCPEGKPLRYRGHRRDSQGYAYCSTAAQCQGCPQKQRCTSAPYRWLFVHGQEWARQVVRALAGTPAYKRSRRARYKIEALFAELKQRLGLRRVRLRRLWNVAKEFWLAATAQNLKRLVRFLAQRQPMPALSTA